MSIRDQDAWDPDDTASFSVAEVLRSPIGVQVSPDSAHRMRRACFLLLVGLALIVVDVRVTAAITVDVVPDLLGGLVILAGVLRLRPVAALVGPPRAGPRALSLAALQLPLLLAMTVTPVGLSELWLSALDAVGLLQVMMALLGAAIVGTVLARAHDALGQLHRRDRWARARRACLVTAVLWAPLASLGTFIDEPSGLVMVAVGMASVAVFMASVVTLMLLLLALVSTTNVLLPDR